MCVSIRMETMTISVVQTYLGAVNFTADDGSHITIEPAVS